jgi:beta-galactosidase/beta-glucuronidase
MPGRGGLRRIAAVGLSAAALLSGTGAPAWSVEVNLGPYNARFLEGGVGLERDLAADSFALTTNAAFTLSGWVRPDRIQPGKIVIAAIGDPRQACRCLALADGRLSLGDASAAQPLRAGAWQFVAAVSDGRTLSLFVGGRLVASAPAGRLATAPKLALAPVVETGHFGGALVGFTLARGAMSAAGIRSLATARPDFDLVVMQEVGVGWPVQVKAWTGLQVPQDPWTLPTAKAAFDKPVAKPIPSDPSLAPLGTARWAVNGWRLAEGPQVKADGASLSRPGYDDRAWHPATVPGTVLQTLIDRGVYPDPSRGLNNLAIPERLARQHYWYRTRIDLPPLAAGRSRTLLFKGINYAAEIWLNGERIGDIKGAFIRGRYDVTAKLRPGANYLAVRISPPPHPGIPHEESIAAGPGENGGRVALDGPTFAASEGWDWIPGVRDREAGLWQGVELVETGVLRILDPKIVTDLPLPRTDSAEVTIEIPVENVSSAPVEAAIAARFGDVRVAKTVTVAPGTSLVRFAPAEFPALVLRNPQLWWPNGYGEPNLYDLDLSLEVGGVRSDGRSLRFGVREVSYDLSLFDSAGKLRRVNVSYTDGLKRGEQLVDVRHEAIKRSPMGWVESLTAAGETSPAVRDVEATSPYPHLAIRVNGVKIAARGGSWGMDDFLKRVSRARLEPYFRLHREANVNIIRNWMGTNTEPEFYDLADEYGIMVLNDFWDSTQNFQLEAEDPALFVANARDTISRYRNHASIILWFGRNEGVPQPVLNEGLAAAAAELDGTRWFTGSSNEVNLQGSGLYNYRPPVGYFTDLANGFSVETGSPSLATLEAIEAMIPEQDRWPISDSLAYHDWHFGGNGDVKSFMETLERQFGAPTSLEDFERKAQMMNFVTYRAIFEGMGAHLWTKNMGRLLWMTHPSWPSNHWQIYSSDYDTHASYYGVKHAGEPIHVQMNLPDFVLAVVNTTREARPGLRLEARVYGLDNRLLLSRDDRVESPANQTSSGPPLALQPLLDREGLVLVKLRLADERGETVSENFYWQGKDDASYRRLGTLSPQALTASARLAGQRVSVNLANRAGQAVLAAKLTLLDAKGERILPAYYSDNYISLLPGEKRDVSIDIPAGTAIPARIGLRGWNVVQQEIAVSK